jgi:osmoprotectant transport system permease protein
MPIALPLIARLLRAAPALALALSFLAAPGPADAAGSDAAPAAGPFVVGSKRFTESYVLGEIVRLTAAQAAPAEHRRGLGNTAVVLAALEAGAIDAYPEYLGTIDAEILGHATPSPRAAIERELAARGLGIAVPFGFSNGYALAMPEDLARRLHVARLSDLAAHPELALGLSHEFLGRQDGWPGLAQRYGLPQRPVGIDHGLSYDAMAGGRIAVTDVYTTDAQIAARHLRVLEDDRHYFPSYDALLLYRLDAAARHPAAWRAIQRLRGRIPVATMISMNARAEIGHDSFEQIAQDFVAGRPIVAPAGAGAGAQGTTVGASAATPEGPPATSSGAAAASDADGRATVAVASGADAARDTADRAPPAPVRADSGAGATRAGVLARLFADDLPRLVAQHLLLVGIAVVAACALGVPIGAAAAAWPRCEGPVMAVVGLLQTIPSLALLAMLIPLLGRIGTVPALVALTLYALLPIARNTATGLEEVPRGLRDSGTALGLTAAQRWRAIDLPLAAPTIIAGIKTAAVITVGTATIAAFVGAGGLGERIVTGLALNDHAMLLAGALPAAALALATQAVFAFVERLVTPPRTARTR